jgi:hypothetical protein
VVFIYNGNLFSHKEILSFTGKWMELESIMLPETSQVQKAKSHIFLSYVNVEKYTKIMKADQTKVRSHMKGAG